MTDLIFGLLYLGIIVQIVLLVKAIKNNERKNWVTLFGMQIIAYITSIAMIMYFNHSVSGFNGAAGIIVGFFVAASYLVGFFVAVCIKIITFELNMKRQGKTYVNPICLILATVFITVGVGILSYVIVDDWNTILIRTDIGKAYIPSFLIGGLLIFCRIRKSRGKNQ